MTETKPNRWWRGRRALATAVVAGLAVVAIAEEFAKEATVNHIVALKSRTSSLSPIVGTVNANTTLAILGHDKSFIQVKTPDGVVGYIMEDDLPRPIKPPKPGSSIPREAKYGGAGRGLTDETVQYAKDNKLKLDVVRAMSEFKAMGEEVSDESLQAFANEQHLGPLGYRK